jgi:hypothetical protein
VSPTRYSLRDETVEKRMDESPCVEYAKAMCERTPTMHRNVDSGTTQRAAVASKIVFAPREGEPVPLKVKTCESNRISGWFWVVPSDVPFMNDVEKSTTIAARCAIRPRVPPNQFPRSSAR